MKKRIDVIASTEAYENLSTFTDIEQLNETVRTYRDVIKVSVKRSDVQARLIALLEILKRHSCKQIGVSYMCKNTIASKLEVSYKTVQRLMKKLENMNMIKQIATKRKANMQQTANAIVINQLVEEVSDKNPIEMTKKCPTIKTTTSSLKQKIKNIRNVSNIVDNSVDNNNVMEYYDYSYVSSNIPEAFIKVVKPFFDSASEIYRLWSRLTLAANKSNVTVHDNLDIFIKTFKESIYAYKQNKVHNDLIGYIYGVWRNVAKIVNRRINHNFLNWLED